MTTISKEKMKLILEELSLVITFASRASELLNHDRGIDMNIIDYSGKRIIFDKHSFVSLFKKEANKVLIRFEVYYNDTITSTN